MPPPARAYLALAAALAAFARPALSAGSAAARPRHIVMILVDDLGFNYPGYRNPRVSTPNIDALAADGVKLDNAYVYRYCSPTRAALLTGRLPWHLPNTRMNLIPSYIMDSTPLAYRMIPERLAAGPQQYVSYHSGKWHQGLYCPQVTPLGRGFNFTDGFLSGGEDHFTLAADLSVGNCNVTGGPAVRDAAIDGKPAPGAIGEWTASRFAATAVGHIKAHSARFPGAGMFMYLALHNTHAPVEAPPEFQAQCAGVANLTYKLEKVFCGMVAAVDSTTKNVTDALKAAGMYEDTLIVWQTDNGSPIQVAGSNHPLRGCKGTNWEGGVRVPAFISGGLVPPSERGTTKGGLLHVADWYSTFLGIAGVPDPANDPAPGFAPVDSLDLWPWLSGAAPASPRTTLALDHNRYDPCPTCGDAAGPRNVSGALIEWPHKLLVGKVGGESSASWYGTFSPNATNPVTNTSIFACGNDSPLGGCLFDLSVDPEERNDLASQQPAVFARLLANFYGLKSQYHPPNENPPSDEAGLCAAALQNNAIVVPWRSQPLEGAERR